MDSRGGASRALARPPARATQLPGSPLRPSDPRELDGYQLLRRLGEGGMGTVYLGRSPTGRRVAVKIVRAELADDPEYRARFRREAEVARRVARYCTAEVLDAVDPPDGAPYLVTEFVDGPPLSQTVSRRGPLGSADVERVAVSVASALTVIHAAGLVHRDLKPSNVLLSQFGPRVIDFGVAWAPDSVAVTRDLVVGTPAFMAPEQARGQRVTSAADIFSWGGLIIFAATGRRPFGGGAVPAVLYRIVNSDPDLDGLDEGLTEVVRDAMRRDPAERPTAAEIVNRLQALSTIRATTPIWVTPPASEPVAAESGALAQAGTAANGAEPNGAAPAADSAGTDAAGSDAASSGAAEPVTPADGSGGGLGEDAPAVNAGAAGESAASAESEADAGSSAGAEAAATGVPAADGTDAASSDTSDAGAGTPAAGVVSAAAAQDGTDPAANADQAGTGAGSAARTGTAAGSPGADAAEDGSQGDSSVGDSSLGDGTLGDGASAADAGAHVSATADDSQGPADDAVSEPGADMAGDDEDPPTVGSGPIPVAGLNDDFTFGDLSVWGDDGTELTVGYLARLGSVGEELDDSDDHGFRDLDYTDFDSASGLDSDGLEYADFDDGSGGVNRISQRTVTLRGDSPRGPGRTLETLSLNGLDDSGRSTWPPPRRRGPLAALARWFPGFAPGGRIPWTTVISAFSVIVALAAVGVAAAAAVDSSGRSANATLAAQLTIPNNLVGLSVKEAEARLHAAGFAHLQFEMTPDLKPKGTVLSVQPGEGIEIEASDTVTLVVSAGLDSVKIPQVVGLTDSAARSNLQDAGLTVVVRSISGPASVSPGHVAAIFPAAGVEVPPGSSVTILVVVPAGTKSLASVPNVIGMTTNDAQDALHKAGFTDIAISSVAASEPAGTVTASDPAANTTTAKNATVTLTVSTGPGQTAVPDVAGRTQADAEAALAQAGLVATVRQDPGPSTITAGLVETVDPAPGSKVPVHAEVTITVVSTQVAMPDARGRQRADAERLLTSYGLTVTVTQQSSSAAPGTVLTQSTTPGAMIGRGSNVTLVVAKAADSPTSPPTSPSPPPTSPPPTGPTSPSPPASATA
ncbi:PASTA domain-containing protein [Pseudofrankia inefficax]|uniref:PASTA domain-containing protein n=1 Tax=Pseudofrankia inefficax (strain DSM 45817 / CECT 9037 / DDB 130130 / EuI1c) TaxID=298654 RepID=UPI003F635FAE